MPEERRLIEDYLPIEEISAEASREKSPRKGHISTLHLWWARRPLVACRAALYGALMPAPANKADRDKEAVFVKQLAKYPGNSAILAEARRRIAEAHRARTGSDGQPKVLDLFAGGGAIPLEALRLGCEAQALDLNPVAHIIQLCTLSYPQKYGEPDLQAVGSGKSNTWAGLAKEVRHWGMWVVERVRAEIGDLYPPIRCSSLNRHKPASRSGTLWKRGADRPQANDLIPIAYLWTRTVTCKNPRCGAVVPLLKQTWLCRKKGRYVALRTEVPKDKKIPTFEVLEAGTERELGFDPAAGSESGNATCPFCSTVADSQYVQKEGVAGAVRFQPLAVVCRPVEGTGTVFLGASDVPGGLVPSEDEIQARMRRLLSRSGITVPDEPISPVRPSPNARGLSAPTRHGILKFSDLFQSRQLLSLLTQCDAVRAAFSAMRDEGMCQERARAVATYLGVVVDRMVDRGSSMCRWDPNYTKTQSTFGRPALPFVWDFSETNPFGDASGDMAQAVEWVARVIEEVSEVPASASVERGSALSLPYASGTFDAIVTDPPYYDNVPYGDLSDFFYVWLKRSIGHLYPEHFSSQLTPKKNEATALSSRFSGDMGAASAAYEGMMLSAFTEAIRVLKPGGPLVVVYAHKTTLGWSTLIDALRKSGFTVTEAWPLDTEFGGRLMSQESAALASSIFLVARKRDTAPAGHYEEQVRPELQSIVRERVGTLWDLGISGADLVISCVGAGLSAFTRYARVEYANGEDVPAERFLAEVETVVLEEILARLSKASASEGSQCDLGGLDPATRFYLLWRYTYGAAELDAGEAIVFANGTHVELDGLNGLSSGLRPLLQKKKGTYRLCDFTDRGSDERLGLPTDEGHTAPLVDALQRTLWLMENRPARIGDFLREAQPHVEQMRLVAQALGGPALKGGELSNVSPSNEVAALGKLTANWRSVIEGAGFGGEDLLADARGVQIK